MTSAPARPPESVTAAVIVCVPTLSTTEKAPPPPIAPSRSEVHDKLAVRSPSSTSLAEATNAILAPSPNKAPLAGLLISTAGAWLDSAFVSTTSDPLGVDSLPAASRAVT